MALQTRLAQGLGALLPLVAPALLRRRLARGKEDPVRMGEKLGQPSLPRPDGRLIWLHGVGVGELLALRGLIATMAELDLEVQFLMTSSARSSAEVVARQLPPRTRHQFLPIDAPRYLRRFLGHWRPALSVWAEQDLWPNAVLETDRAGVPLAMVNARMNAASFARRSKARRLYADLLGRFGLVAAQDQGSASHLAALGAQDVQVLGSLKAASPPLGCDMAELARLQGLIGGRRVWLLASSHPEDEAVAIAAHRALLAEHPGALLIIAPRDPHRAPEIEAMASGLSITRRDSLTGKVQIWLADSFGEMGLWYRLSPLSVIGGSFGPTEGHNPWEPAALGSAVIHGPRVANFANDFARLHEVDACLEVTPEGLAGALARDHHAMAQRASAEVVRLQGSLAPLARDLLARARP